MIEGDAWVIDGMKFGVLRVWLDAADAVVFSISRRGPAARRVGSR
jgi:hypothetical protein